MRSMTGFGRGEAGEGGVRATVEVKTVNRRQLEVVVMLPRELEVLESRLRDLVSRDLSRGRCEVRVQVERGGGAEEVRVDRRLAAAYARELTALAAELGWPPPASVDRLLGLPGVVGARAVDVDPDREWPVLARAAEGAMAGLATMRREEGAALERDLAARVDQLRARHRAILARAPEVPVRQRELLLARLRQAGLEGLDAGDERVLKEILIHAERSDIAEELARLDSHFAQFERCRASGEAVGRTLDFLCQEMHREINTLGSKAADALISAEVVAFKTELERFREQVQNIE